ncbi:MAG TPA: DMT family transporter [Methylomirabilota bacterium]|nr:DMT family transporter [Methylomirabilota bacterium]
MPALSQTRAYIALLLVTVLWGTFPSTAKLALDSLPPVFLTAVRGALASAFLVTLLLRSGADATRELTADTVRTFLVLGVAGLVVSMQVSYLGIYFTTAANAAILQAAAPIMVALGARVYLGERLRREQRLGVGVSALGVLLVVTDGRLAGLRAAELRAGDFLTLAALVGWSAYTVYGKRVLRAHSPAVATAGAYVCGTLVLAALAGLTAPLFPAPVLASPVAWAVVLYHAIFGAVAHLWWYRAVERVGASRAAVFMNVTPVVGVALAWALLGERIGPWQALGAACVLAGVALTTRPRPSVRPRAAG